MQGVQARDKRKGALAGAGVVLAGLVQITTHGANCQPPDVRVMGEAGTIFIYGQDPSAIILVGFQALAAEGPMIEVEAVPAEE